MATTADPTPQTEPFSVVDNSNPLRQFRSYSYHFFLVACESTEVLDYLSSPKATNAFERSAHNLTNPRDAITIPNVGKYIIVLDTRTDVDIVIDDVQWGTTFVGDPNSSNSSVALNVVMTDGIINFIEPRGVDFLNILARLCDQLDVDMICMPFCLKTVFYGHTETGQVIQLPQNADTQPLGFVPVDIVANVDERGTTYKMDICGVVNGIVHNPAFNAIVDGISFPILSGVSLEEHLIKYQQLINAQYSNQLNIIKKQYRNSIDFSDSAAVFYRLQLEPGSLQLQYLNDFGSNEPDQLQTEDGKFVIKGTKEGGFAEVLLKLLRSSQNWVRIAAQGDPPDATDIDNTKRCYTFKVTQEFLSTSPSKSKSIVTANIVISEYRYETVVVESTAAGQTTITPTPKIDPEQVITFDYIFTGRNTEILGMQLDLSMGLALLQTLATARSIYTQGQDATGEGPAIPGTVAAASPAAGSFNQRGRIRKGTPIFCPLQWAANYSKEMKDIQNTATAEAIWKTFASYQSVNTTLNIHGNPLLLGKVINPDRTIPNYVKVNIKMPNTPDDIWEYQLGNNRAPGGYYKEFWYTGYYLLVSAVNKFQGGLFTQELDLVSMPQTSTAQGSVAAEEAERNEPKRGRYRAHFYNESPKVPPPTGRPPTAPVTPPQSTSTVNALARPSNNPKMESTQDFVAYYWNYALQASQQSGLDPDFALAQAAVETGWGTTQKLQNYSSMFNARAYNKPNQWWTGEVIPGTNREAGQTVPPFRAYASPSESLLDQADLVKRLYPQSWNATNINEYAAGLSNGVGGRRWDATDPVAYTANIISTYNRIQLHKAELGIVDGTPYAGGPTPQTISNQNNFLTFNPLAPVTTTQPSIVNNTFSTGRTVAQAAVDQKATVFKKDNTDNG